MTRPDRRRRHGSRRLHPAALLVVVLAVLVGGAGTALAQSAAPGQVIFTSPAQGATVASPVEIVYAHTPACEVDHPAQGPYGQNMLPPEVVNVATGKNEMELSSGIGRRIVDSPGAVGLDSVFVTAFEYGGAGAIPRQGAQRTERIVMGLPDGTYEVRFTQFAFCPGTSAVLRFTVGAAQAGGGGAPAGRVATPLAGPIARVPWFFQPALAPAALRRRPSDEDLTASLAQCRGDRDCEFRVRRIWEIDRRVADLRHELAKSQATGAVGAGGLTGGGVACVLVCPDPLTKGAGLFLAGLGTWWGVENSRSGAEIMRSIEILGRERAACVNGSSGCGYLGGVGPRTAQSLPDRSRTAPSRREAATGTRRPPRLRSARGIPPAAARAVNRLLAAQAASARQRARATAALAALETAFAAGETARLAGLRAAAARELTASARAYRRLAALRAAIPARLRGTALAAAPRTGAVRALRARLRRGDVPQVLRRAAGRTGLSASAARSLVLAGPAVARSPAALLGDRRIVRAERALAGAIERLAPLLGEAPRPGPT